MKFLVVAAALVLALGCNPRDAEDLKQDASKLAQSTGRSLSNMSLAGKIKAVLGWRKGVDVGTIDVQTEQGRVTLSGTVRTEEERKTVVDTVNGIEGVDSVSDKLEVK